jgi:hypothetical protein
MAQVRRCGRTCLLAKSAPTGDTDAQDGVIATRPATAPAPELISTAVPPAKSITCSLALTKPLGEKTQCATGK